VLFERVLAASGNNPSPSVWNLFLEFEYITGDLASVQKIEKRRALAFSESGIPFQFLTNTKQYANQ